jgi:4-diphosphocytidyl-2-C-methyl-D-erythritol kinase
MQPTTELQPELACAKVNLTLRVLGRRADGYHELESLVAFADLADQLDFIPADHWSIRTSGDVPMPVASQDNLTTKAAKRVADALGLPQAFTLNLIKRIPLAAGLGGGSADAAATLRFLQKANAVRSGEINWLQLARELGADVPVCFHSQACIMRGVGEQLELIASFPTVAALLVNPQCTVPANKTAAVFKSLNASHLPDTWRPEPRDTPIDITKLIHDGRNDLQAAAIAVMPEIRAVLTALEATPGAQHARLSGAGPTCFAVFATPQEAAHAAVKLKQRYATWWIQPTRLR